MPLSSNGLKRSRVFKIRCENPEAISEACRLRTVLRGRRFGYVASIGLPITNHFSPLSAAPAAPRCASRISSLYYARPHRALRSRPRPRIWLGGVLEYWSVGVLRFVRIAPRLRRLAGALNASIFGCGGSQLTD
jgi:hypothetical protein